MEEDIVLISVPTVDMFSGPIFISVFAKKDQRRNYKGYDFFLRPSEFSEDPNKEMHIHVLGEKGSMKVRLNPVERDESQPTDIPPPLEKKLVRFVADNIIDIKQRIREELQKRNIKVPPF
ncbi:8410_t:CDS:1 [Ambispora leptoticha]|uniref:8410_t:CDS:1 n=1 Tax=Ambispora leptoticha TaxID=144679 RepID=A0A9N8V572_9GLOM|nr:8410_t:CDS:1 [Ambispora leptoticha]